MGGWDRRVALFEIDAKQELALIPAHGAEMERRDAYRRIDNDSLRR